MLQPARKEQHDDNDQHQPEATTGPVAPVAAVRPPWHGADEQQYQYDQQNGSQSHGLLHCIASETLDCGLAFGLGCVATSIPFFVSIEVRFIDTLGRVGFLTTVRHRPLVTMLRMVGVIHLAAESAGTMKPGACADEGIPVKPFGAIVARGSAALGSGVVVTVRTLGGQGDIAADLSVRCGHGCQERASGNRR